MHGGHFAGRGQTCMAMLPGTRLWLISNSHFLAESERLGEDGGNVGPGRDRQIDRPEFSSTPGDQRVK